MLLTPPKPKPRFGKAWESKFSRRGERVGWKVFLLSFRGSDTPSTRRASCLCQPAWSWVVAPVFHDTWLRAGTSFSSGTLCGKTPFLSSVSASTCARACWRTEQAGDQLDEKGTVFMASWVRRGSGRYRSAIVGGDTGVQKVDSALISPLP